MKNILQPFLFILLWFQFISCDSRILLHGSITENKNSICFNVNLSKIEKIRPLNGIGNGPLYGYSNNRFAVDATAYFKDLNVPIIRYHDVEYLNKQNQAVNISVIFPDRQSDESLESSYNFTATDRLLEVAMKTGAKIIFRLGENIQNIGSATGDNTPPKDFAKWARIAERVVAHYESGWNNGFHYTNIMWEVWNEPDNPQCWNGSFDAYCEFYKIVWRCIHAKHPDADISPSYAYSAENRTKLYHCIKDNGLDIGHCFVHHYWSDFSAIGEDTKKLKTELEQYGLDADIIMDEWNYLSSDGQWNNLAATFYAIQTQRAAIWYAKQLIHMQEAEDLAGAVYYISDMPGLWTGLYKLNNAGQMVLLPAYDVFRYFGKLYKLGYEVKPYAVPEDISVLAALNGKEMGVMVVNDSDKERNIKIKINDISLLNRDILINETLYQTDSEYINMTMYPYEVSFVNILELK